MIRYIALLRGINVGGKHIVKMQELKAAFEELGFKNVKTFIQSGNVVFESREKEISKLKMQVEIRLKERFGFPIPVILRTAEQVRRLVDRNPFSAFEGKPGMKLYVYFLDNETPVTPGLPSPIDKEGFQLIAIDNADALVVRHPVEGTIGYTDQTITKMLKGMYTARNWNTVVTLAEMVAN